MTVRPPAFGLPGFTRMEMVHQNGAARCRSASWVAEQGSLLARRIHRTSSRSCYSAKGKRDNVCTMAARSNVYDSVMYPSFAFLQTHPDRLAVMGTLFGMNPPDVEHCRVLEIACGNGGNLIPMAFGLAHSEFAGVDLAAKPVEMAREKITRLGLKNIRVDQADLM